MGQLLNILYPPEEGNPDLDGDPWELLIPVQANPVPEAGVIPVPQEGVNPVPQEGVNPVPQEGVNPVPQLTPAEVAAALLALLADPIEASRSRRVGLAKQDSLEELILKSLQVEDPAVFLEQKEIFDMTAPPILEEVSLRGGPLWQQPPLAGLFVSSHTRRLLLSLQYCPSIYSGWTPAELDLLCANVARECQSSLRRLEVDSSRRTHGRHPGISVAQLEALLRQLRGLEQFTLRGDFEAWEVQTLISSLAASNPGIKSLRVPSLNTASLYIITARWPALDTLQADRALFTSPQLAAALRNLRELRELMVDDTKKTEAMLLVARIHQPDLQAPYKLTESFHCSLLRSSAEAAQLFTTFPNLNGLEVGSQRELQYVCVGLQSCPNTWVSSLGVGPRVPASSLEPLLDQVGKQLQLLWLEVGQAGQPVDDDRVDAGMIANRCPQLTHLWVFSGSLVAGDEFEVNEQSFAKLEYCYIARSTVSEHPRAAQLPNPLLLRLLASPRLETVYLDLPITEELATAITAESGEGRALSRLEKLGLDHRNSSVRVMATLASHAPQLRELALRRGGEQTAERQQVEAVLTAFLAQSGPCRLANPW